MAINSDGGVRISDLIEGIVVIYIWQIRQQYGRFVNSRGESFYCDKLSGSLLAEKLEGRSKPLSKEEQVLAKKAKLSFADAKKKALPNDKIVMFESFFGNCSNAILGTPQPGQIFRII